MSPEFFEWLRNNVQFVPRDRKAQRELAKWLAAINPQLRWEVGSGSRAEWFLAFSPNLQEKLLDLTNALAREAPDVPGWEFLPAKPRKELQRRTIKITDGDRTREYNFEDWRYYLTSFNQGEFYDVNIIPIGYESECGSDLEHAASLIIESELGEELFITAIDRVIIDASTANPDKSDVVRDLHAHLSAEIRSKSN